MHIGNQKFELVLIQNTKSLLIYRLKLEGELTQEVLMLYELILKNKVWELLEADPALELDLLALCILLLSG